MKARPLKLLYGEGYIDCEIADATHVELRMPRPKGLMQELVLPVILRGTRAGTNCWTWNGDTEKPTLRPSVLTHGRNEDGDWRCHSWINDGAAKFLDDCTHDLRGRTVDLLPVDSSNNNYADRARSEDVSPHT